MTLEGTFALAAILSTLLAPSGARADETASDVVQRDDGFILIKDCKGSVRRQSGSSRLLEVTVTLENTLDRPIRALAFDLAYAESDKAEPLHARLSVPREVPAHGTADLELQTSVPGTLEVRDFEVALTHFTVARPSAEVLLQLAGSNGGADLVAAAEALQGDSAVTPAERAALAPTFIEAVKKGPRAMEHGDTVEPLYALRGAGLLGGADAVPALLGALRDAGDYDEARESLGTLRSHSPAHPMVQLLGDEASFKDEVVSALHAMPDAQSVPALTAAAYGRDAAAREAARQVLAAGWPVPRDRANALRGATARGAALDALCGGGDADAVRGLLLLAADGADDGKARNCIPAVPDNVALAGLVSALGESLGAAEPLVVELLVARGAAAREALAPAARSLTLAPDADLATVARAVIASVKAERQKRLQAALASANEQLAKTSAASGKELDVQVAIALGSLGKAERLGGDARQRVEVAEAYARLGAAAVTAGNASGVDWIISRVVALLAPRPADGAVDASLSAFALRIAESIPNAPRSLERLAPAFFDQAGVGKAYAVLARKAASGEQKEAYARRALKLDPGNATATGIRDELTWETRRPFLYTGALLLALGGIGFAIARSGLGKYRRGYCVNCGKYSMLNDVMFRYNIGMFVARRYAQKGGPFCKGCIHTTFWSYTGILVTVGWWGMISAAVTPFLILGNSYAYLQSLLMPASLGEGSDVSQARRVESLRPAAEPMKEKIASMLSEGASHEEIAERLEREDGEPRASTLALLARLEEAMKRQGAG